LSRSRTDFALVWALRGLASIAGGIVVLIMAFLLIEAWPALHTIGLARFFTDASWHPTSDSYNLVPMLLGTLFATAGAVLLATPLGVCSAVFCHYYAHPTIARQYRRIIELFAGIPSVVYGFWGLVALVPLIRRIHPPGASLLAGILVVGIMILPTVMMTADASLVNVPSHQLRGAAALGLSRCGMLRGVVFPYAKRCLYTGLILQTGRALGETMAILMVCGNVVQTPKSLFIPIRTLSANIALEMAYATDGHRSALFVGGLLLMGMIVVLVLLADRLCRSAVQ